MEDVKICFITDLHFGIQDTERELEELNKNFIPFLKGNKVDILFFGGDYFDHRLSLSESSAVQGIGFFKTVTEICKEKNIKIRMIEGTQSHDRFQPRILENMVSGDKQLDFKLYETVNTETINGLRILYVPEEYPVNIDEFYKPYKESKYNLMIMHATWSFINFGGQIDNSRNDVNSTPLFKYEEWESALEHGCAICGHIHGRHGFKRKNLDKILYPGAFTEWSHDQPSKRGWLYGSINPETNKYSFKFFNNEDSPVYSSLDIAHLGKEILESDIEVIKAKIDEAKEKVNFLKINLDGLSEEKKLILKELYKSDKNVKTDSTVTKTLLSSSDNESKYKKYEYLLNDTLTVEQAIHRFIKEEYDKDISEETIKEIIKED